MQPPRRRNLTDEASGNKARHRGVPDCPSGVGGVKSVTGGQGMASLSLALAIEPPLAGLLFRRMAMSNMKDAVGLRIPYSRPNSQYETEFVPATATAWGYFNPKGLACYILGYLKYMRAPDDRIGPNHD